MKIFHKRMLPTSAGVEPATSWSPVGWRIQLSHRGWHLNLVNCNLIIIAYYGLHSLLVLYKFPTLNFCYGNQTKWPLVIKQTNWVDNHQMSITAKYDLQHFMYYGENTIKPFSNSKFMGPFSCHSNQMKRQINIILAIFKSPYPSNIPTLLGTNHFSDWKSCHFKVLTDRFTEGWTDGQQTKSDHYSSSWA